MIWEIAFFNPRVDAEKDCDAGAGSIPVEQAFGGRRYFAKPQQP
jgi:hypothetical protein